MSVNISNRQFDQHNLFENVQKALNNAELAAEYLELELTETSIMQAEESAIGTLKAIKKLGVKIAMDDFGTGYSSLNTLRRFPIDFLKIDRCFIKNIANNETDSAITLAIISMAKSLNIPALLKA